MSLIIAVVTILSFGVLHACEVMREPGVQLSRGWEVARVMSIFALGLTMLFLLLKSIEQ